MWLLRANLIAQIVIVVTGGIVRMTGSGLGCPTWPECVDGSIAPTQHQAESWHKWVEFGNRTLTGVLGILAIAAVIGAVVWTRRLRAAGHPGRAGVVALAAVPLIGTIGQAVLGGITVLTDLNPVAVAGHFLLSIAIIAGTLVAVVRAQEPGDQPVVALVPEPVRWAARGAVLAALVVITLGVVTTGAGPNSGDADVTHRFGIDQQLAAWIHAASVLAFIALVVVVLVGVGRNGGPAAARGRVFHTLGVTVTTGLVGFAQLRLGLPWGLVAIHMLLSTLVWVAALQLLLSLRSRGTQPAAG